ncbi:MAG: SLC13 family permease [Pseudomonadota bacterium]
MLLVGIALVLFSNDKIPLASSSLLILVVLILFFQIFPYTSTHGLTIKPKDFFSGFGHEALVTVCALMIAGQSLIVTGALEPVGRFLAKQWTQYPTLTFLQMLIVGAVLSAFVNNTPIVILLLPILISVSLRTSTAASSVLMPVGFATLVGGMSTTIGTSTNLLVVSVAADLGMKQFGMFDFILPAMIAGTVAILYLWLIAPGITQLREPRLKNTSARLFSAQLCIQEKSLSIGKKLSDLIELTSNHMEVQQILRGNEKTTLVPLPDVLLREGDKLLVQDKPDKLMDFAKILEARLYSGDEPVDEEHPLNEKNQQISEVVVIPGSTLNGRTLNQVRFTDRYHLLVLALHRANFWKNRPQSIYANEVILKPGDVLLVQGARQRIKKLKMSRNLLVLDAWLSLPHSSKAPIALSIMCFIVLTAALGILPISVSAITGVLLMLMSKCLTWRDASRALSAPVILIIVTSLAMGMALVETGGATFLAQYYVQVTLGLPASYIISGLLLLMALLTNVVSNNAAAVIGTPIAMSIAEQLSLPAEPFVLAVLFGANMSFATPIAYQTNLLVMNAGNYTFGDFVKVGGPLTVLLWLLFSFLLPWLYNI